MKRGDVCYGMLRAAACVDESDHLQQIQWESGTWTCCCLLLQDLYKSCARGGGVKRGDVCYGMLRAAACVDESDHHALMYVRHGQTVREEGVDE